MTEFPYFPQSASTHSAPPRSFASPEVNWARAVIPQAIVLLQRRFNGRIEDVLQSQRFHSGEDLDHTILQYVTLDNQELSQSALDSRTPLRAIKDWHKLKPMLLKNSYNTLREMTARDRRLSKIIQKAYDAKCPFQIA